VARAPTGIPDRDSVTRRRFAPDAARNAPEATRSPYRARSRADASQKPAPRARRPLRVWWRAHRRTFTPTDTIRAGASRQTPPRTRQKPPEARSAPEARQTASQKPAPRARRLVARVVARAPTGIPDRDSVTRQRFAPDAARNAPEATRSPYRARSRADASQKPYRARAAWWRVSWRAHRPAYQTATALRAGASRQKPPGTRQEPAASAYRTLLRFSTITDPVRIRLRRPGIA